MKKFKVIFLSSAKTDLKEARLWYKEQSSGLPAKFRIDVKETVEKLQDRPTVFAVRYRIVRVAHLRVFPYAIHYLIDGQKVMVLGVFHNSMDPGKWDERKYEPFE